MMDTEETPPGQISMAKGTGPSELLLAQGNAPKFLIKNCDSYKKNNAHHLIATWEQPRVSYMTSAFLVTSRRETQHYI